MHILPERSCLHRETSTHMNNVCDPQPEAHPPRTDLDSSTKHILFVFTNSGTEVEITVSIQQHTTEMYLCLTFKSRNQDHKNNMYCQLTK